MRAKVASLLLLISLMTILPFTAAIADQPEFQPIDQTFTDPDLSALCGFPVEVHVQGTLIFQHKGDFSSTRAANYSISFTNLITGRSIIQRLSGLEVEGFSLSEGFLSLIFSGALRLVAPGEGAVFIDAGRTGQILTFDPETFQLISVEFIRHGRIDEAGLELICELLSG